MTETASAAQSFTLTGNVIGPTCSVSSETNHYDFGVLAAADVHKGGGTSKITGAPLTLLLQCTGSRGGSTQKPTLKITGAQDSSRGTWPIEAKEHCFLDSTSTVNNACIFLSTSSSAEDILPVTPEGQNVTAEVAENNVQAGGEAIPITLSPGVMGWSDGKSQFGILSAVISVSLDWK